MAMIKKFCCGCNVRSGSIFSGFYCLWAHTNSERRVDIQQTFSPNLNVQRAFNPSLDVAWTSGRRSDCLCAHRADYSRTVSSGLFVGLLCVRYVGYRLVDGSETYSIAAYATIAIFLLLLCTSITLIIGVYMDIQALFAPWLVICVLCIAEGCGVLLWYVISTLRRDEEVPVWEIVITVFHVINSIILIYCMVCVISQLQDLMAGKGTRRYYRRRRHLRRQRLPPHITPIPVEMIGEMGPHVINLPHGGGGPAFPPPPYSDSPPPYDPMAGDDGEYSERVQDDATTEMNEGTVHETVDVGHGGVAMYAGSNEREERVNNNMSSENTDPPSGTTNHAFDPEPGPSQRPEEAPANFHFGVEDLIVAAPIESHERSIDSPRRHNKRKKKRKHRRSRSRERVHHSPRLQHVRHQSSREDPHPHAPIPPRGVPPVPGPGPHGRHSAPFPPQPTFAQRVGVNL